MTGDRALTIADAPRRVALLVLIGVAAVLLLGILAFRDPLLARYGRWLVREDPETPADAVVVLGGSSGFRVLAGVELVERGLAPRLAMTAEPPEFPDFEEPPITRWLALADSLGVEESALDVLMPTYSTFDDAWLARRYAESHGLRSLIFVTDPYHTRRARWVLSRVFDDTGIRIGMRASAPPWFRPSSWWKDERQVLAVTLEYAKLAYYAYTYGFSGPIGPDDPRSLSHAGDTRVPSPAESS